MRGNESIQESRAHTHKTLGAIACNNLGSAPKPNGNKLTAIIKKKKTLNISERRRQATVISRKKTRAINVSVLTSVWLLCISVLFVTLLMQHHLTANIASMLGRIQVFGVM